MEQKEIDDIIKCLSESRLSKYKKESELEEYVEVILKNQKIYPALHIMEVIFRNKVHTAVGEILQNKDWLLEFKKKNPLLIKTFSSLQKTTGIQKKYLWKFLSFKFFFKKSENSSSNDKKDIYQIFDKEITMAYNNSLLNIKNKKREIIEGDIIASLTFGF